MFTLLNRIRGDGSILFGYSWQIALLIGLLVFLQFGNLYVAAASAIGYYVGELFGWGAWIGTLTNNQKTYGDENPPEGYSEGIYWIASHIVDPHKNWYRYSQVALTIRGFYWWFLTLAPLYFVTDSLIITMAIIMLSIGFPVACSLGHMSAKKWNFKYMSGSWEHQEVWYGVMQDVALLAIFISI